MTKASARRTDETFDAGGPPGLVTVAVYDNPIPARMARDFLVDHEIPVFLKDENTIAITGLPGLGGIKVQVPGTHEQEARDLLADLDASEGLDESFEPPGSPDDAPPEESGEAAAPPSPQNLPALVGLLVGLAAVVGAPYGVPGTLAGGLATVLSVLGLVQARKGEGRGLGPALVGLLFGVGAVVGSFIAGHLR